MVQESLVDFPDKDNSEIAQYAARIARSSITVGTRSGHERYVFHVVCVVCSASTDGDHRIIKAYIIYHRKRNPEWDPKAVTKQTPYNICQYITQKCGEKSEEYDGCKMRIYTVLCPCSALTPR